MKFALVTLGCDKNTVDSERYIADLQDRGGEFTADADDADVILVNTCGFIDAAKKESIDAIVEAGNRKEGGRCQAVVAVGCMVERHKQELVDALPEVDLFLGASEMDRLVPRLEELGLLDGIELPVAHPGVRTFSGDLPHIRYLKISEGCDHGCAFCAIPLMRGKHRSFTLDDVVREAQLLEAQGAREVNLVAQDLAHWGRDRRGEALGLHDLLEALIRETDIPWFRLLYLYSAGLTPQLLELMATESRIVPYLDTPIQHASDSVLKRMRRPERRATILEKLSKMRAAVPEVSVRTTCIVGFPGETEEDFEGLLEFLEEASFDRVGAFTYSPQEGTRAAELEDDVPESVKRQRLERLNEIQRLITSDRYTAKVGKHARAIIDRVTPDGVEARTVWQADDIDGISILRNADGLAPGAIVDVSIDEVVDDVNFAASVLRVANAPANAPVRRRALPIAAGASISSFGR
ncbi:MAG: 30S ribosomal protein S12 methylthiotransferase RimO [Gemmatimonadaceae bacterium]